MTPLEITVIVLTVLFLGSVIGTYIYKKVKHLLTGECASCASKGKKMVDEYHRKYPKKEQKESSK